MKKRGTWEMGFEVIKPGLLSTLQDEGRYGQRKYGIVTSGPMDLFAHRAANILVGNDRGAAALEMTLLGPSMVANMDMLLSLCGADMEADVDGVRVPLWRPFLIRKGDQLNVHYAVKGCRAYLAVCGGFEAKPVMGSRSTYLRAGIGGHQGRGLQAGDDLRVRQDVVGDYLHHPGSVSAFIRPGYEENPVVRVIQGKEAALFTDASRQSFLAQSYIVTAQSDRMGYRLEGKKLELSDGVPSEMISEAVVQGTIQVPPSGQPILLMADCQTTGGYPRIAQVITADLPLAAQVKPGGKLRFREVSNKEAQEQNLLQAMDFRLLEAGVRAWVRDRG
ncbi:biotin-dependent carboxyltransferase family protein [Paenibacillus alginolyticus]|uniref:Biotin-dependent carboxyltransferase family protein n=1 Tax=Paenibacillus alginolyticus TaxID=59839 RepID=A0ABT4GLD8_9BACL|nr:biotin-dependent carboxyltransferase family protein [Paenibacillus alginolyticus]MCY9666031.1 biotin-dependent carboxyltransferase family protein [Paenibacillus alginolyticus]MCY9697024.1 biotin-dependent carboxyltransferase family protein [Paenibacillus alginolyticus]MEC0142162.1 biotin-dependent carboxyltransferase family protein [Paenibacillus alginolyticus]